jgi:hypothetical protein
VLISISHYLYRKTRHQAIAVLIMVSLCAIAPAQLRDRTEHPRVDQDQAQTPSKKPSKRGPRAIAVIEFLPKGDMRLVPIALWMDGKYYDASFYGANPEPMALQPETLYEAMNYGQPTGWFTVTTPKQINGNWVADGKWKPETAFDVAQAHQAAKQPKAKPRSPLDDDSGPPVLRRAPSSGSAEPSGSTQGTTESPSGTSTASASNAPKTSSDDSDRPTLKNSSQSSTSSPDSGADSGRPTLKNSSPSPPSSTAANDDSDRPTLKNSSPSSSPSSSHPTLGGDTQEANAQPPTTPAPPASSSDENDPDRPTLHRGKPASQPRASKASTATAKASTTKPAPAAAASQPPDAPSPTLAPQPGRAYPAISDAGVYETRSFFYPMTPAEREERGRPMLALALDEVRAYYNKRQQAQAAPTTPAKAPAKTAARPPDFVISEYDLRAFDLDFSNSPTFVLTAKVPAPKTQPPAASELDYFVTLVARVDINGQVQKIFSSVTDKNHLDAFPRLEIIDAIDADANGRGDLLFRRHSDSGISYALYRIYPYEMMKLFEGGAGM